MTTDTLRASIKTAELTAHEMEMNAHIALSAINSVMEIARKSLNGVADTDTPEYRAFRDVLDAYFDLDTREMVKNVPDFHTIENIFQDFMTVITVKAGELATIFKGVM